MIPLKIQKRTNHISIEDMQSEVTKIDGKEVKLCLNCNKPIPARNHKYCSPQCSTEFFAKHSQKGLRLYVFKRENGTCQKCG
jgi:Zn finger protein HypA/HybF involved in hydrogenase expression